MDAETVKNSKDLAAAQSGRHAVQLLRFAARLDAVPGAMAHVAQALQQAGYPHGAVARAELIVEELFRNSVLHGYADGDGGVRDGDHGVWLGVHGGRLHYEDAAPPFDPLTQGPAAPDPAVPLERQAVGGIGLLLIRQLGSAIAYEYSDGRNRIAITLAAGADQESCRI